MALPVEGATAGTAEVAQVAEVADVADNKPYNNQPYNFGKGSPEEQRKEWYAYTILKLQSLY